MTSTNFSVGFDQFIIASYRSWIFFQLVSENDAIELKHFNNGLHFECRNVLCEKKIVSKNHKLEKNRLKFAN